MSGKPPISLAERYSKELERFAQEIEYARTEFRNRLERYRYEDNPQSRVDLQSSMAHFERYILPCAISLESEESTSIEQSENLTLGIEHDWDAYEFRHLFEGIDYLSKVFTIRFKLERESPDFRLRRGMTRSSVYRRAQLYYYLSQREELRVNRIEFASPGLVSFEGSAEVIKELRETFNYAITGVWLKQLIDNFWQIRDRDTRRAEAEARRAEVEARRAEADARRYEALLRQAEARSKMRMAIEQVKQYDETRNIEQPQQKQLGLEQVNKLADTAIELDAHGLAKLEVVEDSTIHSLSVLHRLTYEEEKVRPRTRMEDG